MRVLKWVFGVALLAAAAAFLWGLIAPRRKPESIAAAPYVAPEAAVDQDVSVPDAEPLAVPTA